MKAESDVASSDIVVPASIKPRRGRMKRLLSGALTVCILSTLVMIGSATSASAGAVVCVAGSRVGQVCNLTVGSGGRVDRVRAEFDQKPWNVKNAICGYSARLRISAYGNPNHRVWNKGARPGECSYVTAWLDFPVYETYPTGSSWVCLQNYINGTEEGREICIKLT